MENPSKQTALQSPDTPSWRLKTGHMLATGIFRIGSMRQPLASILKPVSVLFESILLGLLRRSDMDAMVLQSYTSKPEFYDPNRYKLPYEERILPELKKVVGDRKQMLDAFCGQGREAEIFARAGFEVTGVDHLDWMIVGARNHFERSGLKATFKVADFASMSAEQRYEIVYTSLWMYSTCQGRDRRLKFLKKCRELCAEDGVVIMSCVDAGSFSNFVARVRFIIARFVGLLTLGNTQSEFGERTYGGLFWHHIPESVVQDELRECGLKVLHVIKAKQVEPTFYFLSAEAS